MQGITVDKNNFTTQLDKIISDIRGDDYGAMNFDSVEDARQTIIDLVELFLIPKDMPIGTQDEQPGLDKFLSGDWRSDKYSNMSAIRCATINTLTAYQRNILNGKQCPVHEEPITLWLKQHRISSLKEKSNE